MNKPEIQTALPQRRYRYGEFSVTVLGEIDSADSRQYQYILAVVRDGDPEPGIYITAERNSADSDVSGAYAMRVVMHDGAQVIDGSDAWRDLDSFCRDALLVVGRILDLGDEEPRQVQ